MAGAIIAVGIEGILIFIVSWSRVITRPARGGLYHGGAWVHTLPQCPSRLYHGHQLQAVADLGTVNGRVNHLRVERFAVAPIVHDQVAVDQQTGDPELDLRAIAIRGVEDLAGTGKRAQRHYDRLIADAVVDDLVPPADVVRVRSRLAVDDYPHDHVVFLQVVDFVRCHESGIGQGRNAVFGHSAGDEVAGEKARLVVAASLSRIDRHQQQQSRQIAMSHQMLLSLSFCEPAR